MNKKEKPKIPDGIIKFNSGITASVKLDISYQIEPHNYIDINTRDEGGGTFIEFKTANAELNDDSILNIEDFNSFDRIIEAINHFKQSYINLLNSK